MARLLAAGEQSKQFAVYAHRLLAGVPVDPRDFAARVEARKLITQPHDFFRDGDRHGFEMFFIVSAEEHLKARPHRFNIAMITGGTHRLKTSA